MCFLLNLSFDLIHGIQTSKQASGSKATARQKQARSEQQERQAFVFSLFSFYLFSFFGSVQKQGDIHMATK
jgi:hypothetical protein